MKLGRAPTTVTTVNVLTGMDRTVVGGRTRLHSGMPSDGRGSLGHDGVQRQNLVRRVGRGPQRSIGMVDLSLREGFARWRRLGVRRGTGAALRLARNELRAPARRARLRMRPLTVSHAELNTALGGRGVGDVLRGPVLAAMPTVAVFERRLDA